MDITQSAQVVIDSINENQGLVTVVIFILTILLGWISGVFRLLRRKPELKIKTLLGPTFVCTFDTGSKQGGHDVHRTGIALYLRVTNVGIAATSIDNIKVGYHWDIPFWTLSLSNLVRYRLGWFYLSDQIVSLADFQAPIGDNIKVYPFLTQKGFASGGSAETFLEPGRSTNGVVYFEQSDSWGRCYPIAQSTKTKIRIIISDSFGRSHKYTTKVDVVGLEEARRFNRKFGATLSELHGSS